MPLKNLSPLYGKKVLLLTHAGCDVDALSSAAAIHFSLKGKSKTSIGVPDHLNSSAAAFAKNLAIPFAINPPLGSFDVLVCIDFSKPSMLGSMGEAFSSFAGEKFLIDHHSHEKGQLVSKGNSIIRAEAVSTSEVVYGLLKKTNVKIPKTAYICIAAGIITDSASFMVADHETFSIMAQVMEKSSCSYGQISQLFSVEKDFSLKIACLKAAKRANIYRAHESIIATSEVGAFEADSSSALVRAGADAAFCGYSDKGNIRVSGRVNNAWMRSCGIDLSRDVFNSLEKYFEGEGGGHAGAGGYTGKGDDVKPVLMKCAELVAELLARKNGSIVQLKEY